MAAPWANANLAGALAEGMGIALQRQKFQADQEAAARRRKLEDLSNLQTVDDALGKYGPVKATEYAQLAGLPVRYEAADDIKKGLVRRITPEGWEFVDPGTPGRVSANLRSLQDDQIRIANELAPLAGTGVAVPGGHDPRLADPTFFRGNMGAHEGTTNRGAPELDRVIPTTEPGPYRRRDVIENAEEYLQRTGVVSEKDLSARRRDTVGEVVKGKYNLAKEKRAQEKLNMDRRAFEFRMKKAMRKGAGRGRDKDEPLLSYKDALKAKQTNTDDIRDFLKKMETKGIQIRTTTNDYGEETTVTNKPPNIPEPEMQRYVAQYEELKRRNVEIGFMELRPSVQMGKILNGDAPGWLSERVIDRWPARTRTEFAKLAASKDKNKPPPPPAPPPPGGYSIVRTPIEPGPNAAAVDMTAIENLKTLVDTGVMTLDEIEKTYDKGIRDTVARYEKPVTTMQLTTQARATEAARVPQTPKEARRVAETSTRATQTAKATEKQLYRTSSPPSDNAARLLQQLRGVPVDKVKEALGAARKSMAKLESAEKKQKVEEEIKYLEAMLL